MNRYVLNQVTSKIESDGRRVYVTLRDLPPHTCHPLIEELEGKTLTIVGVRDKGKHQNAWDVLVAIGVIK